MQLGSAEWGRQSPNPEVGHIELATVNALHAADAVDRVQSGRGAGLGALSQTRHLQSDDLQTRPLDSEVNRKASPREPEEIRDHPRHSVALDLFQRSQVQILPPLQSFRLGDH